MGHFCLSYGAGGVFCLFAFDRELPRLSSEFRGSELHSLVLRTVPKEDTELDM